MVPTAHAPPFDGERRHVEKSLFGQLDCRHASRERGGDGIRRVARLRQQLL